jgi:hypothetical protein
LNTESTKHEANWISSVYYSVIRKEDEFIQMSYEEKLAQDLGFLHHMSDLAKKLRRTSFLLFLFPRDIQVIVERLFVGKPPESDVGGLLGLIMIAGLGFEEDEYFSFLIKNLFQTENESPLFEGTRNLGIMLFGVTLDDVSKTSNAPTDSTLLTILYFRSVYVFRS